MPEDNIEIQPLTNLEIAQKKIETMGLSESEYRMVKAMDMLMQSRFDDFEERMYPYFVKMIGDHLDAISDGLNEFLVVLDKESIVPKELEASMQKLMGVIENLSVEGSGQFTSAQLHTLHHSIVVPLKAHVKEGIVSVNRNINDSYDGLVSQTKLLAQQLADRIKDSKIEIKERIGEVRAKVESIPGKRTFS